MRFFRHFALLGLLFLGLLWTTTPRGAALSFLWRHPVAQTQLPVPVQGVLPRQIANTWGAPRSGGRRHAGVDIFARRDTPVRAATPGLVWRVGQNRLGGNVVWLLAPGGELHYYAHLQRFAPGLGVGQWVLPGQLLGTVGTTGNAQGTPPHLHFGVYGLRQGGASNPWPRLVLPWAGSQP